MAAPIGDSSDRDPVAVWTVVQPVARTTIKALERNERMVFIVARYARVVQIPPREASFGLSIGETPFDDTSPLLVAVSDDRYFIPKRST